MSNYEYLKNRFCNDAFKDGKSKKIAIEKAYADMSRRATGHKPYMKEICVSWLLNEVFNNVLSFETQDDFNNWHQTTCAQLKEKLNACNNGFGSDGRAQKVINMAFKYLSCINDDYNSVLQYCHMTLDGYTLNWYTSVVIPWAKKKAKSTQEYNYIEKPTEWSKLEEKDYRIIQVNIRDFLKEDEQPYSINLGGKKTNEIFLPKIPFEAEFIIWEGEIIKDKYSALINELNHYVKKTRNVPAGKEKDKWLIQDLLINYLKDYVKNI